MPHQTHDEHTEDDYEPVTFPRDEWPARTYYYPGLAESGDLERRIRFAAQQASRKIARGIWSGDLDGEIEEVDVTFAVLDVVLELWVDAASLADVSNDEFREDCRAAQRTISNTVDEWRGWLGEATRDVASTASQTLSECTPALRTVFDKWHDSYDSGLRLVVACMEQVWSVRDSREPLCNPAPRETILPLVDRFGPGPLEKMVWHGRALGDEDDSTSHFTVTWDGIRTPATPKATGLTPGSSPGKLSSSSAKSESPVSPRSAQSDHARGSWTQPITIVDPSTEEPVYDQSSPRSK